MLEDASLAAKRVEPCPEPVDVVTGRAAEAPAAQHLILVDRSGLHLMK